ncbi:hydroxymethylglutaryl-CoA reductase, degradative [Weissella minor]|uniref:3-hydroxy-3-methylglutaryl coenzyme A reductase n=1 Tax=Weissella minor TaxID=1620 RepID=A0A0R2JEX2_9LACO|nr:hydroxymethylglutaryl-CoA reductase, degradative [Weissella minor]KRN75904.1 3-hydroxy-3-methylglutaryl-coenzyme A reductase 3-hydroxy-3-methylglutaryl-coenzyme Auctase [Weissella minor]
MNWNGFYKLSWTERINALLLQKLITFPQAELMRANYDEIGNQQIENYLYSFGVPTGLLTDIVIDGVHRTIPMATEEPSVVAAANNGARMMNAGDGVQTEFETRLIRGQIVVTDLDDTDAFVALVVDDETKILSLANQAHPSMAQRGGGAKEVVTELLDEQTVAVDILVDPCDAMGANVVNTMAEAVSASFREQGYDVLMGILSNYATEALITAKVSVPVASLKTKQGTPGLTVAQRIEKASRVESLSPYRAVTANKGIMNGVEAVVLASGNDTRAVNAGFHAYAAQSGQYQGMVDWRVDETETHLLGEITMPAMVGVVGGSIGIVPAVKMNQALMANPDAKQLSAYLAGVALAQNLAALRALVSSGIQAGHMALQAKSLAVQVGAKADEIPTIVQGLKTAGTINRVTAEKLLDELRGE